jgi:hypothetical protein
MRIDANRWLVAGGAIAGVGGAAVVGLFIYVESGPDRAFWTAAGWLSSAALALGLVMLCIGFFAPASGTGGNEQHQHSGSHSINLQAGGDIRVSDTTPEDQP